MHYHNWTLKAFGALLECANLERFSDEFKDASEYRGGLNGIIEIITERQEKIVDDLIKKYDQSPEYIIQKADQISYLLEHGGYRTHEDALKDINEAIGKLDTVIENFDDEYPRAMELKIELTLKRNVLCQNMKPQEMTIKEAG